MLVDADWGSLLSRDELLGGFPARRASTALFAIESRTAQFVNRSRTAMATYLTERNAEESEQEFLSAIAEGRDLPRRPTVQDLERYAAQWASLVPPDVGVRAALSQLLGNKYLLVERRIPGIRAALGLADPAVAERFQQQVGRPLSSIYAPRVPVRERVRWITSALSARLENLPPFWTAFSLTLTETVGSGILALPIAFATVGPVAGMVALVVLGLVNVLTIVAMSEAVARNGNVRYGRAYFGRLVGDYLGKPGSRFLTTTLLLLNAATLLAYFIGLSTVLTGAFGAQPEIWAGLIFLTLLVFLRRETLDATVASALLVGASSISLVVILSLIALPHVTGDNLRHAEVPFRNGMPFDSSVLELVFGVVLLAYFGHSSTANCAAVVLAREPSGRSLIKGCAAAQLAAVGLYCVWVMTVGGAVSPVRLANESGTALEPLADQVGPIVHVFGVAFSILAMGMASIHVGMGLGFQIKEWLPTVAPGTAPQPRLPFVAMLAGKSGRVLIGLLPALAIFVVAEVLLIANRESFSGLLGFVGLLTAPIVAGIFSMLMVHAARRKGDCAVGFAWRWLDHPVVLVTTCGLFFGSILVHALIVWDDPWRRAAGLVMSGLLVWFLISIRSTAFVPRAVVEMRLGVDPGTPAVLNLVAPGRYSDPGITWENGTHAFGNGNVGRAVRGVRVRMPALAVRECKVWTHQSLPDGTSEGVATRIRIAADGQSSSEEYHSPHGVLVVPFSGAESEIQVELTGRATAERWRES